MTAAARARALAGVGRLGEAEEAVRAGLSGVPDDPDLLSLLACLLRLQGRRTDALAAADAAVTAAPHAAVPHIERAECLLLLPEHAGAGLSGGFRRAGRAGASRAGTSRGGQAGTGRAGASRGGRGGRADAGRAGTGRADAGRADAGRAGTGRAGTGRADAGRADAGRAGAGRAGAGRAGTGRAGTGRADAGRAGAGRAGASRGGRAGTSPGVLNAADEARTAEALAEAREAVRLQPAFPPAYRVLARTLAIRRDFTPAREAARRALELAPHSVPDLITLADVERLAGRRRAARAAVRAALAEDPENPDALWLIALLDAERLRVGAAMSGLRGLAAGHPADVDATVMTWPIRGLLDALCRGLKAGVLLTGLLAPAAIVWPPALLLARAAALTVATVMILFTGWVLIPAGRLPWCCLGLLPARTRGLMAGGGVAATVSAGALLAYALTARWPALVLSALAMVVLRALGRRDQG